ncbi:MAG: HAMP domain-containing histidine kinase [Clostridiales bacterium]|nr:HAMP domain-containing histidine kinase [Clostridiales bacterium]
MDKVKRYWRDLSLRKSIVFYILIFAVFAIALSMVTSALCYNIEQKIYDSYPISSKKYYLTTDDGERLGEGAYISKQPTSLSKKDERIIAALELIPIVVTPIYSALCIIAAALLFYQDKLKEPLAKLQTASEKISQNDLDFHLDYQSANELGQLCNSFEIMRYTLADNFSKMWRQVEERKRLNAAFAHDLRTPLTVLKGYNEMLRSSEERATRETALTMAEHILRLERYVDSMSNLSRLEDMKPQSDGIDIEKHIADLIEKSEILCRECNKRLTIQNSASKASIHVDWSFVSRVCDNLLANALRYAVSNIVITFTGSAEGLVLAVTDDGKGFSKEVLDKALTPYFTEEENRAEHFGLGLYICKILCERHGGYLKIENVQDGARVTAFFKALRVMKA